MEFLQDWLLVMGIFATLALVLFGIGYVVITTRPWVGNTIMVVVMMLVAALLAFTKPSKADTIGVHMGSVHSNNYDPVAQRPWNNANPGLYYVRDIKGLSIPDGAYVIGTYFNSVRKQSVYVGYVYPISANFDLTVGVISGYNGRGPGGEYRAKALMPMVVPSFHFPITDSIRGRVHVAPGLGRGSAHAVHFSVEFKL